MSVRDVSRDFFCLRWASLFDQPSVFVIRLTVFTFNYAFYNYCYIIGFYTSFSLNIVKCAAK